MCDCSRFSAGFASLLAFYAGNWAQTNWYIDGVNGNDTNSGINPAAPLKTGAELASRLGPRAKWAASVTVTILAAGMIDPLVLVGDTLSPGVSVNVVGTPTQVAAAGTVATVAAMNHATPAPPMLTATGVADWTPYVGKRLRVTAGTAVGCVAWVTKVSPLGLGVATCSTTVWTRKTDTVGASTLFAAVQPVIGDTIVIETVPVVPSAVVEVGGTFTPPVTPAVNPAWPTRQMVLDSVDAKELRVNSQSAAVSNRSLVFGSLLANVLSTDVQTSTSTAFLAVVASLFSPPTVTAVNVGCVCNACGFLNIQQLAFFSPANQANNQMQNAPTIFGARGVVANTQFWDAPSSLGGVNLAAGGQLFNVSGSGNLYGWVIPNGTTVTASGTINLKGTTADVRLSGAPATNLTMAQLTASLPVRDFAQSGTATLGASGAGYVDVALPWWDNVNQKVIYNERDDLGGHPVATVTCPSVNRTAAGFRLTSTSGTDVSTYDWYVTPLGRNIFVNAT